VCHDIKDFELPSWDSASESHWSQSACVLTRRAQVQSDGIHSTPLNLAVYWKCGASASDLRVDYRYNPESMAAPGPLSNVQILVPVDGEVTNMQSLPNSVW